MRPFLSAVSPLRFDGCLALQQSTVAALGGATDAGDVRSASVGSRSDASESDFDRCLWSRTAAGMPVPDRLSCAPEPARAARRRREGTGSMTNQRKNNYKGD